MNLRRLLCFLLLVLLPAWAQQDAPKPPASGPNLDFDLLVVRMPEETALPLIAALRDRKRAAKAAQSVVDLVAKKKATLIGWPVLTTKSAERAVAEQVEEVRYVTEYEAPGVAKVTESQPVNPFARSATPKPPDPADVVPPGTFTEPSVTTVAVFEGIPTAFETRNCGVTLEIEGTLRDDGKTIDLQLVPQHVRLAGFRKSEIEVKGGKTVIVSQPDIVSHRTTTQLTVQDGDHTLLGVFKVNDPPGQIELFILHSQVRSVEAATPASSGSGAARR